MKNNLKSSLIIGLTLLIATGCSSDDVEDLVTTTVTTNLSEDVHVSVSETDPLENTQRITFDASADVANLDIDKYEITKLTIEISNYTGEATEISDLAMVVNTNLTLSTPPLIFADVNNKGPINIPADNSIFTALADEFAKDNKLTLDVTATLDNKPADFDLEITIHGKVTGSLIK